MSEAVSVHHAWRTCTLSPALPRGVWLLRRLRPPSRTLALSCPTKVGRSGMGVPQCQHKRQEQPIAASSPPGGLGTTPAHVRTCQARRYAIVALGYHSHLSPRPRHDASDRGSSRPQRLQDASGQPPVAGPLPPCSSQASDPTGCRPLTPAASSSYRCPRMVLCKNNLLRR